MKPKTSLRHSTRDLMPIIATILVVLLVAGAILGSLHYIRSYDESRFDDGEDPFEEDYGAEYDDPTDQIPDPVEYRNGQPIWWDEYDEGPQTFPLKEIVEKDSGPNGIKEHNDTQYNTREISKRIIENVNEMREEEGLHELQEVKYLDSYARGRAYHFRDHRYYDHEDPMGNLTWDYMGIDTGKGLCAGSQAENIAPVLVTKQSVDNNIINETNASVGDRFFEKWMNSEPHREAMQYEDITFIGVGTAHYSYEGSAEEGDNAGVGTYSVMLVCGPDLGKYPDYDKTDE